MAQQILEADNERKPEPAGARFVHHLEEIDRAAGFLERFGDDVAGTVDREIPAAPTVDVVSRDRGFHIPLRSRHRGAV